jgi:hypothetical protein
MPPIALALALALATPDAADNPADLAGRVGSADPGVREEAEGRLEEIGRPALPDLRIALEKAESPVAARRLADLVDLIERKRLLRATPVALDERNIYLFDAAADLSRRSGLRVALDPPDDPAWAATRVTMTTPGPIGFWDAVDRLGASGGVRVEAGSFWPGSPKDEPAVRLVRGEPSPIRASYAGPYRVELVALERHRQVTQPRPGRAPKSLDEFAASLQVVAEPGLILERNGSPRLEEALDDRGADLRPASPRDPALRTGFSFRQWQPTLSVQAYRVPLAIPAERGGTLRRLRGTLPIVAYARTGPLMTVPLGGIVGRPLSASGVTLTVRKVERPNNGPTWAIQAVVRGEPHATTPAVAPGPRQITAAPVRPNFAPDDHIQVLDDRGRPFLLSTNASTPRPDGTIEFTVLVHTNTQSGPPNTLRYYGLVAEAIEVPFAFEDVPMP